MNPLEAAALSKMTGYTYIPYEHPEPPPLEKCWKENNKPFYGIATMAGFLGTSTYSLEQHRLNEEYHD